MKSIFARTAFVLFTAVFGLLLFAACGGDSDESSDGDGENAGEDSDGDIESTEDSENADGDADSPEAESEASDIIDPHKEVRGDFIVVWLAGTPREMGRQQGELLHDELAAGMEYIRNDIGMSAMVDLARSKGIMDLAYANSYPEVIEECEGMVETAGDVGWTVDQCLALNFGDVLVEFLIEGMPDLPEETKSALKKFLPGCSQFTVSGRATSDGRLYHGRLLDWSEIGYILENPTIFVRQPNGGIPHIFIGFPGNLSPYSGINAEGLVINSNEADPLDSSVQSLEGGSHVQLVGRILQEAHNYDEAAAMVQNFGHMSAELVMVSDGNAGKAAAFEMCAAGTGIRELDNDVVYMTNHFVSDSTSGFDADPIGDSSRRRFDRLAQLLPEGASASLFGTLNPQSIVENVLRDRVNPDNGEEFGLDVFDNDSSLATNGALFGIIYDPAKRVFWVAAGYPLSVPSKSFVGFSVGELLGEENAVLPDPAVIE